MYTKITAAAIVAAIPAVRGLGQAVVKNKCDFPVYLWSVSDTAGSMQTLDSETGNWSEQYRTNSNGGGISIKISRSTDAYADDITQFEYTLTNSLWYDLSNINGYPFEDWGLTLAPSEQGCPSVLCPSGVSACNQAYNVPTDDHATHMCSSESNTVLVLCSGQSDNQTPVDVDTSAVSDVASAAGNVVSAAAAAVVPSSAPASSAAPAVTPVAAAEVAPSPAPANVFTTLATQVVTVSAPAASEPVADNSGPQWFGHHEAGWVPKAKRHVHHPHVAHA